MKAKFKRFLNNKTEIKKRNMLKINKAKRNEDKYFKI